MLLVKVIFLEYANSLYFYSENDKIDSIQFFTYNPYSSGLDKTEVWYYDYEDGQIRQILKLRQDGGGELVPFEEALYSAFQNELFGKKENFEYSAFDGEIISHSIDSFTFDDQDRVVTSYFDYYYDGEIAYRGMQKIEYYDDFIPVKSLDGLDFFNKIVDPTRQQEYDPQNFDIVAEKFKSYESYIWDTDSDSYTQEGISSFFYNDLSSKTKSIIGKSTFDIFPNPVEGFLNIEGIENIGLATYWIYGMDGKLLMSQKLSTNNIDVTMLNAGTYLLRIQTDSSNDVTLNRFIKI